MARYWCPSTMTEEPLFLGGFASLRQGAYAIGAAVITIALYSAVRPPILLAIPVGAVIGTCAYAFGWAKHPRTGEFLDRTILRAVSHSRQCHLYLYRKGGGSHA